MQQSRRAIWIAANTSWYVFNFRARLIERLLARGYSVVVLAPRDAYSDRLVAMGVRCIDLPLDNAGTNPIRDGALWLWLCALFIKERPGLLLTFTPKVNIYCALAARWLRISVIANVSGLGSGFLRGGWMARLMRTLYRMSLRHASLVYFQNADDREVFLAQQLVNPTRTELLPGSGVDVEKFAPALKTSTADTFTFLMVARLLGDKGVREFVHAARALHEDGSPVQCVLVGAVDVANISAITRAECEDWQQRGWIKHFDHTDDVRAFYANADCVVLPSYREGTSRVLLEAASMGRPLIATDVPGCREVIDHGVNGFLCRARDGEHLLEQMRAMLQLREEERSAMGIAGRRKVLEYFDENIVLMRYLDAVERCHFGLDAGRRSASGTLAPSKFQSQAESGASL